MGQIQNIGSKEGRMLLFGGVYSNLEALRTAFEANPAVVNQADERGFTPLDWLRMQF